CAPYGSPYWYFDVW
nr:immunoglobulin heavy chain junction region [Mus musculus]MBK4185758.1 immunoglobulin heavy chain junction region [Mus musculus]MBK4185759.1 immunoglobulin heavy chain junction region [Mus musculus]